MSCIREYSRIRRVFGEYPASKCRFFAYRREGNLDLIAYFIFNSSPIRRPEVWLFLIKKLLAFSSKLARYVQSLRLLIPPNAYPLRAAGGLRDFEDVFRKQEYSSMGCMKVDIGNW